MSDLDLRLLRYFVAVYDTRSFTAAARRLRMSQPPLSQAVVALERDLGVRLFERSTRSVVPTTEADVLYAEATFLLRRADEVRSLVRGRTAGDPIRIAAITSTFPAVLPAILPAFADHRLVVTDRGSAEQRRALRDGQIDLAILRDWGAESEDQIVLANERLVLALPEGHRLAGGASASLGSVADEPIILFERDRAPVAFDTIVAACRDAGFSPEPVAQVQSEQAMLGLVSARIGVAVVPEIMALTRWPGVCFRDLDDVEQRTPLLARVAAGDPRGLLPMTLRAFRAARDLLGISVDPPTIDPVS